MATLAAVGEGIQGRFGTFRHISLSAFWFGSFFLWQPFTFVIIQDQVDQLVPDRNAQGAAIGLAVSVGGLFATGSPRRSEGGGRS